VSAGEPWPLRLVSSMNGEAGRHYTCNSIVGDAMEILRSFEPDDINWVFLSTSGVHGSYCSLDAIERALWDATDDEARADDFATDDPEWTRDTERDVTVLIVLPRMVTTCYGNATIRTREDVALLRRLTEQTIAGVMKLESGNRAKEAT
jgi:hypothetical protein